MMTTRYAARHRRCSVIGLDAAGYLEIFYQTLHEVFPEVKVMEGDEEL